MILAAAFAGVVLYVFGCLAWAAHLVYLGNLEALALAEKAAVPEPVSVLDWPDLQLRAVVAQPDERSLVLLDVFWPARPHFAATVLVALDRGDRQSLSVLSQWCAAQVSVASVRQDGAELELRRRRSFERVHARLLAESAVPAR